MTWQMVRGAKTNTESHKIKLCGSLLSFLFVQWLSCNFSNLVDSIGISLLFIWFCRFLWILFFWWFLYFCGIYYSWLNYVADTLAWLANKLVLIELLSFMMDSWGFGTGFFAVFGTVIFIVIWKLRLSRSTLYMIVFQFIFYNRI